MTTKSNNNIKEITYEQRQAYLFCFRYYDVYKAQKKGKKEVLKGLLKPYKHISILDFEIFSGLVQRNINKYISLHHKVMTNKEIRLFFK